MTENDLEDNYQNSEVIYSNNISEIGKDSFSQNNINNYDINTTSNTKSELELSYITKDSLLEEKKKKNKEQKEIENEILHKNDKYKLAQFENIPSKLKENTKNWITNEKTKLKPIKKTNTPLKKNKNRSQNKKCTY